MLKGLLYLIVIALSLLVAAAGGDEIIVETSHAIIESHEGKRLRVVFAAEDRPTLIFKPEAGAWDWSQTSQLVIPVENPGDEALTMSLSVEDHTSRSLTGKVAIAPQSAGSLAISVGAPSAALHGHDRRAFASSCGPRSRRMAGHGDGRRNRRLAYYVGTPWDIASIGPSTSHRRDAAR